MNLGYILSRLTILLHFSVTFLIVCIGFGKDFKLIGLKLIQVSSITIFMLTDLDCHVSIGLLSHFYWEFRVFIEFNSFCYEIPIFRIIH